jgi:hypothetical protein
MIIEFHYFDIHSVLFGVMWQGIPLVAEITIQGNNYSD